MAAPGVTIKKQLLKLSNYVPTWVEGLGRNPRGVIFAPGAKISFLVHPRASRRPLLVGRGHGRYFVGTVTGHLGSQQAIQANLDAVVDVLKNAGIAHFVYGTAAGQHPVVGCLAKDRVAVVSELVKTHGHSGAYVGVVSGTGIRARRYLKRSAPSVLTKASVLRFFKPQVSPTGILLSDDRAGCDIEFWRSSAGVWTSPVANPYATELAEGDRQRTEVQVGTGTYDSYPAFVQPDPFVTNYPIDVVYTWVDGNDPAWQSRKRAALGDTDGTELNPLAANESRFSSRDELKYSLRSVAAFADWVRHIYLVTDDQVPDWLDTSSDRITVVSHKELFPDSSALPTFNSHAIETVLHRIPGLSEHFLYMNDDVFIGRPITPDLFFSSVGGPKFFRSTALFGVGPRTVDDAPVDAAGKNNRDLLAEEFGVAVTNKFKHTPHALRKSVIEQVEKRWSAEVERTRVSSFRDPDDIAIISLSHYFGYFTEQATAGNIRYEYVNIALANVRQRYRKLLTQDSWDAFCLNDTDNEGVDMVRQERLLSDFLQAYFPVKSPFEN